MHWIIHWFSIGDFILISCYASCSPALLSCSGLSTAPWKMWTDSRTCRNYKCYLTGRKGLCSIIEPGFFRWVLWCKSDTRSRKKCVTAEKRYMGRSRRLHTSQGTPAAGRNRGSTIPQTLEMGRAQHDNTWTLNFWPLGLRENLFLLFKGTEFVGTSYRRPRDWSTHTPRPPTPLWLPIFP